MYPPATVKSGFIARRAKRALVAGLRNLLAQRGKLGAMLDGQPLQFLDRRAVRAGLR